MLNEEISSLVGGLRSSSDTGLSAFARMEQKVQALEAEAEAAGQIGVNELVSAECPASGHLNVAQCCWPPTTVTSTEEHVSADHLLHTVPLHQDVWPGILSGRPCADDWRCAGRQVCADGGQQHSGRRPAEAEDRPAQDQ